MATSNFEGFSWTEEKSSIILEIMTHLVINKKLDVLAWQDFAVATPSLTPHLSFFPLWMLFAANAGVWRGPQLLYWGSLPPPCRAVGLAAAPPPGSRGLHAIELKF